MNKEKWNEIINLVKELDEFVKKENYQVYVINSPKFLIDDTDFRLVKEIYFYVEGITFIDTRNRHIDAIYEEDTYESIGYFLKNNIKINLIVPQELPINILNMKEFKDE